MMGAVEARQLRDNLRDDLHDMEERLSARFDRLPCDSREARIRALEEQQAAARAARWPAFLGSMMGALIAGAGLIPVVSKIWGR